MVIILINIFLGVLRIAGRSHLIFSKSLGKLFWGLLHTPTVWTVALLYMLLARGFHTDTE